MWERCEDRLALQEAFSLQGLKAEGKESGFLMVMQVFSQRPLLAQPLAASLQSYKVTAVRLRFLSCRMERTRCQLGAGSPCPLKSLENANSMHPPLHCIPRAGTLLCPCKDVIEFLGTCILPVPQGLTFSCLRWLPVLPPPLTTIYLCYARNSVPGCGFQHIHPDVDP